MAGSNNTQGSEGNSHKPDELTRAVREGVRPESKKDRILLAADMLVGNAPLGIDARNKTLRKTIGSAGELLHLLKCGLMGLFLFIAGLAFVYVGLSGELNLTCLLVGLLVLALGVWGLRSAYKAGRNLRSISKA
jgi:hypothetical protein